MTPTEYDALVAQERALWHELTALEAALRVKNAQWEAAAATVAEADLRQNVRARLDDRVAAERRKPEGA